MDAPSVPDLQNRMDLLLLLIEDCIPVDSKLSTHDEIVFFMQIKPPIQLYGGSLRNI